MGSVNEWVSAVDSRCVFLGVCCVLDVLLHPSVSLCTLGAAVALLELYLEKASCLSPSHYTGSCCHGDSRYSQPRTMPLHHSVSPQTPSHTENTQSFNSQCSPILTMTENHFAVFFFTHFHLILFAYWSTFYLHKVIKSTNTMWTYNKKGSWLQIITFLQEKYFQENTKTPNSWWYDIVGCIQNGRRGPPKDPAFSV